MLSRIELKKKSVGIIFHKKKHTRYAFLHSTKAFVIFFLERKVTNIWMVYHDHKMLSRIWLRRKRFWWDNSLYRHFNKTFVNNAHYYDLGKQEVDRQRSGQRTRPRGGGDPLPPYLEETNYCCISFGYFKCTKNEMIK